MGLLTTTAKVGVAVTAVLLFVRGAGLYYRNNVTISITELVRLPPAAVAHRTDPASDIVIKGKVEVATSVMRSYRFLLRLTGAVRNEVPTAAVAHGSPISSPRGVGGGGAGAAAVSRRRVLSSFSHSQRSVGDLAMSDSDSVFSHPHTSGPALVVQNTNEMVDVCEIDLSGHICFTPACLGEDTLVTYVAHPAPAHLSSLANLHSMRSLSGPQAALESDPAAASASGPAANRNPVLAAALTGGPDGAGNVAVRGCYVQADDATPNAQKLSVAVEVVNPVHGLQLLIRLPHRRCRMLRADTGGVGKVHQPLQRRPHRLVWEIGTVEETKAAASTSGNGAAAAAAKKKKKQQRRQQQQQEEESGWDTQQQQLMLPRIGGDTVFSGEDDRPNSSFPNPLPGGGGAVNSPLLLGSESRAAIMTDPALGIRLLMAQCSIVFEQPTDVFDEEEGDSDDDDDDSDGDEDVAAGDNARGGGGGGGGARTPASPLVRKSLASSSTTNNNNNNNGDDDDDDDEALFSSLGSSGARRALRSATMRSSSPRPVAGRPRGAASAPNQSNKAARREAKMRKKREGRQRRREEAVLSGRGAVLRLPTVEVTYSANGLASGTGVRKLQVVSDRPNWVARSIVDRWVLKPLCGSLDEIRLKRFAHYTTWFIQSVPVVLI